MRSDLNTQVVDFTVKFFFLYAIAMPWKHWSPEPLNHHNLEVPNFEKIPETNLKQCAKTKAETTLQARQLPRISCAL